MNNDELAHIERSVFIVAKLAYEQRCHLDHVPVASRDFEYVLSDDERNQWLENARVMLGVPSKQLDRVFRPDQVHLAGRGLYVLSDGEEDFDTLPEPARIEWLSKGRRVLALLEPCMIRRIFGEG